MTGYLLCMSNMTSKTPEQQSMIQQVRTLLECNRQITEDGGFFTAEQIANEKVAWPIICSLRFDQWDYPFYPELRRTLHAETPNSETNILRMQQEIGAT